MRKGGKRVILRRQKKGTARRRIETQARMAYGVDCEEVANVEMTGDATGSLGQQHHMRGMLPAHAILASLATN